MKKACPCVKKKLKTVAVTLKTIAEDTRLRIICLLLKNELCVCELTEALGLPHNLLLHHLKALTERRLIIKRSAGKYSYYSLNKPVFTKFKKQLALLFEGEK
ncbi:MAG: metalloregulator ArsR/SmtB family transcription factor [Candidatus Margulisiibacteriota bacterium]|jgi:DNA-binding transcriptional ArsR family regulator